jgi:hypothetical protein
MGGVRGGLGGDEGWDHPRAAQAAQIVGSADTFFYSLFFILYSLKNGRPMVAPTLI